MEISRSQAVSPSSAPLDQGRIVIVSPHLDDAVMSLGATIARSVHLGAHVEVLTVFGYGPTSSAASGPWDRKSGFDTEGQAAVSRRREDARACRVLGASQRILDFGAEPYDRRGSHAEVRAAVVDAIGDADVVLMPGFPLVHPDHAELTQILLKSDWHAHVGLYAEQPYRFYERKTIRPEMRAAAIDDIVAKDLSWTHLRTSGRERRLKMRAIRAYRSQLWQLGLSHIGLYRMLWHEASQGGEAIAWLS